MARKRHFATLALAAALCLSATGCSTSASQISRHNAAIYVQGVLDETYTGAPREAYLTLMDRTAQQAEEVFTKNLSAEYTQRLVLRFELEDQYVSRSLREDFLALLDTVYAKSSYTVKTATPLDNGRYCVELSVTPVTFFAAAYADGYKALRQDFDKTHGLPAEEEAQAMDPAELRKAEERYYRDWAQAVYDYLYPRLDNITTGPAVTKLVLVSPDSDGLYTLSATDLQDVDDLILQY